MGMAFDKARHHDGIREALIDLAATPSTGNVGSAHA
jgi:hypothetical protein